MREPDRLKRVALPLQCLLRPWLITHFAREMHLDFLAWNKTLP